MSVRKTRNSLDDYEATRQRGGHESFQQMEEIFEDLILIPES